MTAQNNLQQGNPFNFNLGTIEFTDVSNTDNSNTTDNQMVTNGNFGTMIQSGTMIHSGEASDVATYQHNNPLVVHPFYTHKSQTPTGNPFESYSLDCSIETLPGSNSYVEEEVKQDSKQSKTESPATIIASITTTVTVPARTHKFIDIDLSTNLLKDTEIVAEQIDSSDEINAQVANAVYTLKPNKQNQLLVMNPTNEDVVLKKSKPLALLYPTQRSQQFNTVEYAIIDDPEILQDFDVEKQSFGNKNMGADMWDGRPPCSEKPITIEQLNTVI
mmetsp:Transcript_40280/g.51905  ORF Transcript_40280/g.51905 Transcript_40280/m.51905 type:complete len:274 (-) Transcript_40280:3007-3828(-)